MTVVSPLQLESHLRAARQRRRKLVVPYVTGGFSDEWIHVVEALAFEGVDAIEIGIPFSDPVMDGPVIQEASARSLQRGSTPQSILAEVAEIQLEVPLIVMTYVNLLARAGYHRMARSLVGSGISGAIVPDLQIDEAEEWMNEAEAAGLAAIQLVAPTTPDDRLLRICRASHGFVYAVGLLGVTGERSELATSSLEIARRCTKATDAPVLVGVGISNVDQAVRVCAEADGVVIGSALMRRLLDGEGPIGAAAFARELRTGLDRHWA